MEEFLSAIDRHQNASLVIVVLLVSCMSMLSEAISKRKQ
jgi:hypothetical protein